MSVTKDLAGNHVFNCEGKGAGCHKSLETHTPDFNSALNVLRLHVWQAKKNQQDKWENFCPDCQQGTLL